MYTHVNTIRVFVFIQCFKKYNFVFSIHHLNNLSCLFFGWTPPNALL